MPSKSALVRDVTRFFELVGNRRLYIQTHDIPDPDALASAEAFRLVARHFGVSARLVANGFPHRRDNKAMLSECSIHLRPLDSIKPPGKNRVAWAFMDCMPGGGNVTLLPTAPGDLLLAIDHHGAPDHTFASADNAFIINDRTIGATATLLTRLLFELEIPFPPRMASALSYAIITDTQDFSRGTTEADLKMYAALFPFTNQRIISRLRNVTRPREYYGTLHTTLENAKTYRHVAWAYIEKVITGESVAEIADFLLACERITWSLVLGHTTDRLYISIRSSQPKARAAIVIRRIIADLDGTVGGHNEFAGGYIRLGKEDDTVAIADDIMRRFVKTVLRIPKRAEDPEAGPLIAD
jgi:nanoRNase/pAp phosphatase (c-di-AMP/oligoRNAs hydrolase)